MRLSVSALGLSFALFPVFAGSALAGTILSADCSVNQRLCLMNASTFGQLHLTSSSNSYVGSLTGSDSSSVAGSISPAPGITLQTLASGIFNVDYGGFHTVLSSTGDIFCGRDTCPFSAGASAESEGFISDYFGTGNNVPTGTQLALTFTVDAVGNSISTSMGTTNSSLLIDFTAANKTCSNPTVSNIVGAYSYSCTLFVPVVSQDVIEAGMILSASSTSNFPQNNTLNASNTAKIASAILIDSNGNPLPNVQLYDASGFDYNAPGTGSLSATPEPAALILLATGSLGVAGQLRRRFVHKES